MRGCSARAEMTKRIGLQPDPGFAISPRSRIRASGLRPTRPAQSPPETAHSQHWLYTTEYFRMHRMSTDMLDIAEPAKTSLVSEVLFPLPALRRTPVGILTWWESRRLIYNVIVGTTGLVTLGILAAISIIPPGLPPLRPPLAAILAYGVLANVCYTFGPFVEIALERIWGNRVLPVGPSLFRQGLSFSVGLTLLPIILASGMWVARLAMWVFGS